MLFVHGGPEAARRRFEQESCGDWSQGLQVVLEKHGYLDFRACPVAELDPTEAAGAACVVISRLDDADWSADLRAIVLDGEVPVLLEGPLPADLRRAAGITSTGTAADGSFSVTAIDPDLRRRGLALGMLPGSRIEAPRPRPINRDADREWAALPTVPIEERQAAAWSAPAWGLERWELEPGTEVLAECRVEERDEVLPGVVRHGHVTATAFGMLSYLVQAHTSEPWPPGTHLGSPRSTGLELLLLGLIDQLYASGGSPRPRVLPWPRGAKWALTVRHDFDRFLSPEEVENVVERHAEIGTSATWYWRARHLEEPSGGLVGWLRRARGSTGVRALRVVAGAPGHEVAHHTEQLYNGAEREQALIEAAAGHPVAGTCAHGDPTCFRFQGAPNVLWAADRGLRYTELIQHAHFHPHRFPALSADGSISVVDVVCLPHHESFDLSMQEGDTGAERILRVVDTFVAMSGLMQVMNHPDLNRDALFDTLGRLPRQARWDCTADEAACWWLASHTTDRLKLSVRDDHVRVESTDGVSGLMIEVLLPSGDSVRRAVNLEAGESTEIAIPATESAH